MTIAFNFLVNILFFVILKMIKSVENWGSLNFKGYTNSFISLPLTRILF